jgi:hypothetical protein
MKGSVKRSGKGRSFITEYALGGNAQEQGFGKKSKRIKEAGMIKQCSALIIAAGIIIALIIGAAPAEASGEDATGIPGSGLTASQEWIISSAAVKARRHIAQARADIYEKNMTHAQTELKLSLELIAEIKASLPTARIKDLIGIARQHLAYEHAEEVAKDLVPIYSSLDELKDTVRVDMARNHIENAAKYLKKGEKEKAGKEFKSAEESLVYSEIDRPLAYTEKRIIAAQGFLAKNAPEEAERSLQDAEKGVAFVDSALSSPIARARKSLWMAARGYVSGRLDAAKADLREARNYLEKEAETADAKTKADIEKLAKDIRAVEKKVDKAEKTTAVEIQKLLRSAKELTLGAMDIFQAGGGAKKIERVESPR